MFFLYESESTTLTRIFEVTNVFLTLDGAHGVAESHGDGVVVYSHVGGAHHDGGGGGGRTWGNNSMRWQGCESDYTVLKNNLNLLIHTEPATVGADSTKYVWFLFRIMRTKA